MVREDPAASPRLIQSYKVGQEIMFNRSICVRNVSYATITLTQNQNGGTFRAFLTTNKENIE